MRAAVGDRISRQSTNAVFLCFFYAVFCCFSSTFFLAFQTTRLGFFWRGSGTCSSFGAMVFCCRELLFSKLLYRHQQQQPPPASSCRRQTLSKKLFFQDFRRHVRQFFSVVLKLARPLEPWCFAAGSCFFRSYCTGISSSSRHLRAAAGDRLSRKKLFFQDFRRHVRQFFGVVLDLARPSEPWCFAAGSCFFRTPPVVRAAVGDRISRQSTNTVFLCCFYAVFLLFF